MLFLKNDSVTSIRVIVEIPCALCGKVWHSSPVDFLSGSEICVPNVPMDDGGRQWNRLDHAYICNDHGQVKMSLSCGDTEVKELRHFVGSSQL